MSAFREYIIAFFLPLLISVVCLCVAEFIVRQAPNVYKYKHEYIRSKEFEILVLGSSHAYFGINPEFFSSMTISFWKRQSHHKKISASLLLLYRHFH
jgi:hypothetical protein